MNENWNTCASKCCVVNSWDIVYVNADVLNSPWGVPFVKLKDIQQVSVKINRNFLYWKNIYWKKRNYIKKMIINEAIEKCMGSQVVCLLDYQREHSTGLDCKQNPIPLSFECTVINLVSSVGVKQRSYCILMMFVKVPTYWFI